MPAPSARALLEMLVPRQLGEPKLSTPTFGTQVGPPSDGDVFRRLAQQFGPTRAVPVQQAIRLPTPSRATSSVDALVERYSQERGLDPNLVRAIITQESGWNPSAVNKQSMATGLMQVMPQDVSERYGGVFRDRPTSSELLNPETNIDWGTRILAQNLKTAGGDVNRALELYSGGYARDVYNQPVLALYRQYAAGTRTPPETIAQAPTTKPTMPSVSPPAPTGMAMPAIGGPYAGRKGGYADWSELQPLPPLGEKRLTATGAPDLVTYLGLRRPVPTTVPLPLAEPLPVAEALAPSAEKVVERAVQITATGKTVPEVAKVEEPRAPEGTVERAYERLGYERGVLPPPLKEWPEEIGEAARGAAEAGYALGERIAGRPTAWLGGVLGAALGGGLQLGALALRPIQWEVEEIEQRIGALDLVSSDPRTIEAIASAYEAKATAEQTGDKQSLQLVEQQIADLEQRYQKTSVQWVSDLLSGDPERRQASLDYPKQLIERFVRTVDATKADWQTAMRAADVGAYTPGLIQRAWVRMAINGEDPEEVALDLIPEQSFWREAVGQTVMDPLMWLDLAGYGPGTIAMKAMRMSRAKVFVTPTARTVAEVVTDTQKAASPTGVQRIIQKLNPFSLTTEGRQARIMDQSSDVMRIIASVADTPQQRQRILMEWAGATTEEGLQAFAQKYGLNVTLSVPGKRALGLIQTADAEGGLGKAIARAANEAAEQGLTGTAQTEHVLAAVLERTVEALDKVAPPFETVYEKVVSPLLRARKPLDPRLAQIFMGTNPGYAFRNAYNNFITALFHGVVPFGSTDNMLRYIERVGAWPTAAGRGIGAAQPVQEAAKSLGQLWQQIRKRPLDTASHVAQYNERWFSNWTVYRSYRSTLSHVWPKRVRQKIAEVSQVLGLTKYQEDVLAYRLMGVVNEGELRDIVARFVGNDPALRSKVLSAELAQELQRVLPELADELPRIVRESADPESAINRLNTEARQQIDEILARMEGPDAPIPKGSPTEAALKEVIEAAGTEIPEEWMKNIWWPRHPDYTRPINQLVELGTAAERADLQLAARVLREEIIPAQQLRSGLLRRFFDTPKDQRGPWDEVIDSIARDHAARARRIIQIGREAGFDLEGWPIPRPEFRRVGAPAAAAPTAPPARPLVEAARLRQEFAEASRAAGFTTRPDGSLDIGAEVYRANALRQAGIPVEGGIVDFNRLSPEQQRRAIDVLRERPPVPTAPARFPSEVPSPPAPEVPPQPPRPATPVDSRPVAGVTIPEHIQESIKTRLYEQFPIDRIQTDPARFQYRVVTGPGGVTAKFAEVTEWSRLAGGRLLLWREPETAIVWLLDGHHRLDLAKRLGRRTIRVEFSPARTVEEAIRDAAFINIAAGHGTALDAGKFLRSAKVTGDDLARWGVSLREKVASDGLALANLHPSLFSIAGTEALPIERAVLIGQKLPEHNAQLALIRELNRRKRTLTNSQLSELIDLVQEAPTTIREQLTLFGVEQLNEVRAFERAEVLDYIRAQLVRDRGLFSTVADEANRLARAGNVIEIERSQAVSREAAQLLDIFNAIKHQKGPISDVVNDAARRIAEGGNATAIKQEAYDAIRRALPDVIRGREALPPSAAGRAPLGGAPPAGQRDLFGPPGAEPYHAFARAPSEPTAGIPSAVPLDRPQLELPTVPPRPSITASEATVADVADEWQELLGRVANDIRTHWATAEPSTFSPQQRVALEQWTRGLLADLNDAKTLAMNVSTQTRDFVLLDYSHKRAFDRVLSTFLIYPFWATRTYPNWAIRAASHPAFTAAYLRYKAALREENKHLPEWLRDEIEIRVPGLPEAIHFNVERSINPLQGLLESFDDPDRRKTALGEALYTVDRLGFSPYPPLVWTYAIERYLAKDYEAGEAALGHPAPISRAIQAATGLLEIGPEGGVALPPWLWRGEPFFGGDKWQMRRVSRRIAEMEMEGAITPTEAHAAARAMSTNDATNPIFRQAMQMEVEDRGPSTLLSYGFALGTRPRNLSDIQLDEAFGAQSAIYERVEEMSDQEWSQAWDDFYRQYPWMSSVSLARKDRERADTSWTWDVLNRIPPGQGRVVAEAHGFDYSLVEKFYEIGQDDTEVEGVPRKQRAVAELKPWERMKLMAYIMELAEEYDVPTPALSDEWQAAKQRAGQLYDAALARFPGVRELESQYYQLLDTDALAADRFAEEHPEIFVYRRSVNEAKKQDPLLAWYYAPDPRKQAQDIIWAYWHSLPTNRTKSNFANAMGDEFQDYFLKGKYDRVSDESLLLWAQQLGGILVRTAKTEAPGRQVAAPATRYVTSPQQMRAPSANGMFEALERRQTSP